MRQLIIELALIVCITPLTAYSEPLEDSILRPSSENGDVTHIDLSKTLSSKVFGELRLPFSWEAEETKKPERIIVTEGHSKSPGVLTLDMLDLPVGVDVKDAAQSIAESLSSELSTHGEIRVEKLKSEGSKRSINVYKASIVGKEGEIPRKCALDVVQMGKKLLVMTVCAHESRVYEPELSAMLDQILLMIK